MLANATRWRPKQNLPIVQVYTPIQSKLAYIKVCLLLSQKVPFSIEFFSCSSHLVCFTIKCLRLLPPSGVSRYFNGTISLLGGADKWLAIIGNSIANKEIGKIVFRRTPPPLKKTNLMG